MTVDEENDSVEIIEETTNLVFEDLLQVLNITEESDLISVDEKSDNIEINEVNQNLVISDNATSSSASSLNSYFPSGW